MYGGASSKPVNNYDVELVAAPGESTADNYSTSCKAQCHHHGDYMYTQVCQPASLDIVQYHQHAVAEPLHTTSAAGPVRHCCRDHVYDSPTFDENGIDRSATVPYIA